MRYDKLATFQHNSQRESPTPATTHRTRTRTRTRRSHWHGHSHHQRRGKYRGWDGGGGHMWTGHVDAEGRRWQHLYRRGGTVRAGGVPRGVTLSSCE